MASPHISNPAALAGKTVTIIEGEHKGCTAQVYAINTRHKFASVRLHGDEQVKAKVDFTWLSNEELDKERLVTVQTMHIPDPSKLVGKHVNIIQGEHEGRAGKVQYVSQKRKTATILLFSGNEPSFRTYELAEVDLNSLNHEEIDRQRNEMLRPRAENPQRRDSAAEPDFTKWRKRYYIWYKGGNQEDYHRFECRAAALILDVFKSCYPEEPRPGVPIRPATRLEWPRRNGDTAKILVMELPYDHDQWILDTLEVSPFVERISPPKVIACDEKQKQDIDAAMRAYEQRMGLQSS